MKKLDLKKVADEFEVIDSETHLFYNKETGEFDFYGEYMSSEEADSDKFEEDCWISAPSQYDINEYDIMVDFAEAVTDSRANELLCVALEGRGAFRRFKDTLNRVGLVNEWYEFRSKAFIEIAREWCDNNNIDYEEQLVAANDNVKDKVANLYKILFDHYGDLHWWPAKTPYEVMVGAILTQNTAWRNVEKAIANFGDNLSPEFIAAIETEKLGEIIRPAGFFNQKAVYLKKVTSWYKDYSYAATTVQKQPLDKLRLELLAVKGIGQETADSILLYAFGFPTFVIDAYTRRLCERYAIAVGKSYNEIKTCFEGHTPKSADIYNHFHALIVINAKEHCRKNPLCNGCPLERDCMRCGV